MATLQIFGRPRSSSITNPFYLFNDDELDHLDAFSSSLSTQLGQGGMKVDWVETPEAHVFRADLPGMNKDDIKVEVRDGKTLSISGERKKEAVQEKDSWRCVERSHGKFHRQFALPENAEVENVAAKVEDGVLTVSISKRKAAKAPRVRSINIS